MDVLKMIQDLLDERNRIDATIAKLEALREQRAATPAASRRGRKAMSPTEREEVSRRMRNYWDQRRAALVPVVETEDEEKHAAKAAKAGK